MCSLTPLLLREKVGAGGGFLPNYMTLPGLEVMTVVCLHFLSGFDMDMAGFIFIQSTEVCQLVSGFFTKVIYSCVAVNQCFHWGKECPRLSIMHSSIIYSMFLMLVILV